MVSLSGTEGQAMEEGGQSSIGNHLEQISSMNIS
jgi:hypothetical protein